MIASQLKSYIYIFIFKIPYFTFSLLRTAISVHSAAGFTAIEALFKLSYCYRNNPLLRNYVIINTLKAHISIRNKKSYHVGKNLFF